MIDDDIARLVERERSGDLGRLPDFALSRNERDALIDQVFTLAGRTEVPAGNS